MKNLLVTALAGLVLSSSAFAYNPKEAGTITAGQTIKLVPTKVVTPSNLPRSFQRDTVTVEFSLNEQGEPQNVQVVSRAERGVKEQVVKAFKQWKFDPAAANGSKRYVMPVEVVVPEA